ncbi:MAG: response regulator [Anaerolineae bacterium]|nr:response regulator [Anaerolineae bacterium]
MTKILVIEDEETVRENILEILSYEGFEIAGASNGRDGVAVAREFLPDVIVCDIAMPEMDGYSVLVEVRQIPEIAAAPFIFLTARTDRAFMRHGMELGADDYLTKPFSAAELLAAIMARIERRDLTARNISGEVEEAKRQLVQMVAHELRTPLVSIEMSLDIISRQVGQLPPNQMQELLDYIGRGSNRLHHVVDQMVFITQLEAGLLTPAGLREHGLAAPLSELLIAAVNQARRFATRSSDVSVRTQEGDEDVFVWGDTNALKHALAEIIANALHFSPQGTEIVLSQWVAGQHTVIAIVDQGPGIPPQQLANVLREFHQVDRNRYEQQGMGLGLPLARRLIEVHGGALDIQSVVGRGTQVTVQLPLARDS